jgi:hypothetical protein
MSLAKVLAKKPSEVSEDLCKASMYWLLAQGGDLGKSNDQETKY